MTRGELTKIVDYLKNFKKLESIYRVDDTIFKLIFDKKESVFFDMTKGNSYIFKKDDYKSSKIYNAAFDIALKKRCSNAYIDEIDVLPNNKILHLKLLQKSSYKAQVSILQFEFTGRHTNVILCDNEGIILEALRYIDKSISYREIKKGIKLPPLPSRDFKEKNIDIDNIKSYLYRAYQERIEKKLHTAINQKLILINKKIDKLKQISDNLPNEDDLIQKSTKYKKEADLILSNLSSIKNYQKKIILNDFKNNKIEIVLPKEAKTPAQAANILYRLSKKSKQKAKNLHIEKENINSKINYLQKLETIIKDVKSLDELKLYFPNVKKIDKKDKTIDSIETFYYNGYKISLGKNEKANIALLKNAKMSDIWLHLKDIPSTHVIISSNKTNIPDEVLRFAANLCVKFSTTQKGSYLVDYTTRRYVKIISGAKVNYINYKTIKV